MRLDKMLSNLGYGSRKEIAYFAKMGLITYEDEVIKDVTKKYSYEKVKFDGKSLDPLQGIIIALYKPKGYICSHSDSGMLVYSLLEERLNRRNPKLSTIGRLDIDTSGLILFSDDGKINHYLTSPKNKIEKVYEVTLQYPLKGDEVEIFASGSLMLNGEEKPLLPANMKVLDDTKVHLTINEGRYHQVKRMFATVGNKVVSLHRLQIGKLTLDGLNEGEYRYIKLEDIV